MKQSYNGTPVPSDAEAIEYPLPRQDKQQSGVKPPHSMGKTPPFAENAPFAEGAQGKQQGAPAFCGPGEN